jgi:aromatic-L-amino-acid/L-tryptophan decarboxylase
VIEELRVQIDRLRRASSPLEPGSEERRRLGSEALEHALGFLDEVEAAPSLRPASEVFNQRLDPEFAEDGRPVAAVLDYVGECIDRPGIATTSPRFMGYIPGGGLFYSALGDMLAAASNKYSGFAPAAPGAVRIENACTQWLSSVIGYPVQSSGTLTSGGSMANLTAIVAAREARDSKGGGAIYLTRFAHHCIDKALHIAGRGHSPRRLIATDAAYRMSVGGLEQALEEDHRNGIRPWLIVASAGTVDTGAIDPLSKIADLARRYDAWLHVDGAYGGLFALCESGRALLQGIERADSVALDPHKTLFLPYGTGAAIVRDGRLLFDAFNASADYIHPFAKTDVGPSPSDLSPELTRHFRALRLWLPLQVAGIGAFRAAQAEKLALARYFHARLSEMEGFDPGPPPDLSVVAFRYRPRHGDIDEFNQRLMNHIQNEGRVMMSGTRIDGSYYLRCAILCFRTHLEHVDEAIDAVARGVEAIGD